MKGRVLLISALSIVLGCSVALNLFQKKTLTEKESVSESLKIALNKVSRERDSIDEANAAISIELSEYKRAIDSAKTAFNISQSEVKRLTKALKDSRDQITKLSYDEKYESIKEDWGSNWDNIDVSSTYSFDEAEIDSIYDCKVRVNYLDSIRWQQNEMINNMLYQLKLAEGTLENLEEDNLAKQKLIDGLYSRLEQLYNEKEISEADNRHLRNSLRKWQTGSTITVGGLLILLALL